MGENLLSLTLFGSVARGKAKPTSDIDLLSLVKRKSYGMGKKIVRINVESYGWKELRKLRKKGVRTKIYNIITCEKDLRENPLILLDFLEEGKILYDREGRMKELLEKLKKRLKELGVKKVVLKDGRWYWDLKPSLKPGETLEIKL